MDVILWRSLCLESLKEDIQQSSFVVTFHTALSSCFQPQSQLTQATFRCLEANSEKFGDNRQQTNIARFSGPLLNRDMAGFQNSHVPMYPQASLILEVWCGLFSNSSLLVSLISKFLPQEDLSSMKTLHFKKCIEWHLFSWLNTNWFIGLYFMTSVFYPHIILQDYVFL